MALGHPKVALILTDDERVQLNSLAHRSRTAPHLAVVRGSSSRAPRASTTRSSRNGCGCRNFLQSFVISAATRHEHPGDEIDSRPGEARRSIQAEETYGNRLDCAG
jgi:hypothetical protein